MSSINGIGLRTTQQKAPIKNIETSVTKQTEKNNEIPSGPEAPGSEFSGWEKAGMSAKNLYNGPAEEEMEKNGIPGQEQKKMSEENFNKIKETMNILCDELQNFYKKNEGILKNKNNPEQMMAIVKGDMPNRMEILLALSQIAARDGGELPPELQQKVNETLELSNVIGFPLWS